MEKGYYQSELDDDPELELAYLLENHPEGDQRINTILVREYANDVFSLACSVLSGRYLLDSACQEAARKVTYVVFTRAFSSLKDFRGHESVRLWLYEIAVREAQKANHKTKWLMLRNKPRKSAQSTQGHPDNSLLKVLSSIKEKERTILLLRYRHHLPVSNIARLLHRNTNTIRRELDKSRAKLKPILMHHQFDIQKTHDAYIQEYKITRDEQDHWQDVPVQSLQDHFKHCESCRNFIQSYDQFELEIVEAFEGSFHLSDYELAKITKLGDADQFVSRRSWTTPRLKSMSEALVIGLVLIVVLSIGWYFLRQDLDQGPAHLSSFLAATPTMIDLDDVPTRSVPDDFDPSIEVVRELIHYTESDLSEDGQWIVFTSSRSTQNINRGRGQITSYIMLYEVETGQVSYVTPFSETTGGYSYSPSIAGDGRWIVYSSNASVIPDQGSSICFNGRSLSNCQEIFLYDRETGKTIIVSRSVSGLPADGDSYYPVISGNGRWVVYWSAAGNLDDSDGTPCGWEYEPQPCVDIFIYDRLSQITERIPVGRTLDMDSGFSIEPISISSNGDYIAITIHNTDQIAQNLNIEDEKDVFVYDRRSGDFEPVDTGINDQVITGSSTHASLSLNGDYVAYAYAPDPSTKSGKFPGQSSVVMVRDRWEDFSEAVLIENVTDQESIIAGANFTTLGDWGSRIAISAEGRYIVYIAEARSMEGSDIYQCAPVSWIPCYNIYIYDRQTGINQALVSNPELNSFYLFPSISADGRLISYVKYDLECQNVPICSSIYLHDRKTGLTSEPSVGFLAVDQEQQTGWQSTLLSTESQGGINDLEFSPDGNSLATAPNDGVIRLWNIIQGDLILSIDAHQFSLTSIAFFPDGSRIVSGAQDGKVKIWSIPGGALQQTLDSSVQAVLDLDISPDGRKLVIGATKSASLWEYIAGRFRIVQNWDFPNERVNSVAFSPDGERIALGISDGTVWLLGGNNWELQSRLPGHQKSVQVVSFSPDGLFLATGSADRTVNLWKIQHFDQKDIVIERLMIFKHIDWVNDIAFTPDGSNLGVASYRSSIRFWGIPDGVLSDFNLGSRWDQAQSLDFSPDGKWVAIGSAWGGVQLWYQTSE